MAKNIYGSVASWSSGSGTIKTEDGKEFSFTQDDVAPTRCTRRPLFSLILFNNFIQCMPLRVVDG